MNVKLNVLRELVISAAKESTDTEMLDLVWRLLVRTKEEGTNHGLV